MELNRIEDVEEFRKIINECEGQVWLESVYGDKYNLKSALTQYVAIADLITHKREDLELFASNKADEMKLIAFLNKLV